MKHLAKQLNYPLGNFTDVEFLVWCGVKIEMGNRDVYRPTDFTTLLQYFADRPKTDTLAVQKFCPECLKTMCKVLQQYQRKGN